MDRRDDSAKQVVEHLDEVFVANQSGLIRYLRGIGVPRREIEETAQQTYIAVRRGIANPRPIRDMKAFILYRAELLWLGRKRKHAREGTRMLFDDERVVQFAESCIVAEDQVLEGRIVIEDARGAIKDLSAEQKRFLKLSLRGGLSARQIAAVTGFEEHYVERELAKARAAIDSVLGKGKRGEVRK
jgi:DNA-directed RNA polymerase specialized sigma24 family protein